MEMQRLTMIVDALGDRMKVMADAAVLYREFHLDFPDWDNKAVEKYLKAPDALAILTAVAQALEETNEIIAPWTDNRIQRDAVKHSLDRDFRAKAKELDVKFVDFMQTLRVAVTGREHGIDMYSAILILGTEGVMRRVVYAVRHHVMPGSDLKDAEGGKDVFKSLLDLLKGKKMSDELPELEKIDDAAPDCQASAACVTPTQQQVCEESIRTAAYYKWEAAGRPCGDGAEFWAEAEKELNGESK